MFIHQSRLEHLLPPEAYYSPEQHRSEVKNLFRPSWHPIACKADLPKPGDFLTMELFDTPLILRNFDGDYRCFVNVCAHRHTLLTHEPRGNSPSLVCQYHGWEYKKDGSTAKIPDARCFRPWDRENARLRTVRTELCGDMIFICLDPGAPSFAEQYGAFADEIAGAYASPYRLAWTYDQSYESNWKIFIENSLESYHTPLVHPKTFGPFPPEKDVEHEMNSRWTGFRTENGQLRTLSRYAAWYGVPGTQVYQHRNIHPNTTLSHSDAVRLLMTILPTSPTTSRHRAWLFTLRGEKPGWFKEGVGWAMAKGIKSFVSKVVREDVGVYADVQRGLEASPYRGVIGTREERIYVFQKYIRDRCAEGDGTVPVPDTSLATAVDLDPATGAVLTGAVLPGPAALPERSDAPVAGAPA